MPGRRGSRRRRRERVRRQVLRAHRRTRPGSEAATAAADQTARVQAALRTDATLTNLEIAHAMQVSVYIAVARRAELERTGEIHVYRGGAHAPGCWCGFVGDASGRFALVTWHMSGSYAMAQPRYFPTREAAEDAAPDEVHTIIDLHRRPNRRHPTIDELIQRTRTERSHPTQQHEGGGGRA